MDGLPPFHLAIRVRDITEARRFYGHLLGCPEGRSATTWVDFDFFGHQLVCHVAASYPAISEESSNAVDGHDVPVPHFGAVLEIPEFNALSAKLREAGVQFVIEPYTRFKGETGEQSTMFFLDPSGNAIELKAFRNLRDQLFAK